MNPIPRQRVIGVLYALAEKSPRIQQKEIQHELERFGGDLKQDELGKEVSEQELRSLEGMLRQFGGNDEDIRNFHRSLGLRP